VSEVRRRGDAVRVRLSADEAFALGVLAAQVVAMLAPEEEPDGSGDPLEAIVGIADPATTVERPDDPALLRLLPDGYGDAAESGEFRRLTEADLRRGKVDALRALAHDVASDDREGVALSLSPEETEVWLGALNDIRLVLGTRLDVTEDLAELVDQMDEDDPRLPQLQVYDWLGWLQESMIRAVS
jgi:hypothetical protein